MKTPTLDEMKLAVAKMLPEEICVADGHIRWLYGGTPMRPVGYREWLHVCWLAEQLLCDDENNDEMAAYCWKLDQVVMEGLDDLEYNKNVRLVTATADDKIEALCRVKHPTMFLE